MSHYFRDRVQGAGAIAAHAPAPRSAPSPVVRRQPGYISVGAMNLGDRGAASTMGKGKTGTTMQPAKSAPKATAVPTRSAPVLGSKPTATTPGPPPSGPRTPTGPVGRPPPAVQPGIRIYTPTATPGTVDARGQPSVSSSTPILPPSQTVPTAPTQPPITHLPPKPVTQPGPASGPVAPYNPGGGRSLPPLVHAPDPAMDPAFAQSAMPGFAPAGAGKLWLVLGAVGVAGLGAFLIIRKRRPGRR